MTSDRVGNALKILRSQLADQVRGALKDRKGRVPVQIHANPGYDMETVPLSADDAENRGWTRMDAFIVDCEYDEPFLQIKVERDVAPVLAQERPDEYEDYSDADEQKFMPHTERLQFVMPIRYLVFRTDSSDYVIFPESGLPSVTRELRRQIADFIRLESSKQTPPPVKPVEITLPDLALGDQPVLRAYCKKTNTTVTLTVAPVDTPTTYHITIK